MNAFQLTEHLWVYKDHINVGILIAGNRAILIEFTEGAAQFALSLPGVDAIEAALISHYHRDQACGIHSRASKGMQVIAPADEQRWFDRADEYWKGPEFRWHVYSLRPQHLVFTEPVQVARALPDGDVMAWGPVTITAISTPGHTDGSLSYLVEADGRRFAFTGDLVYASGQVWDVFSLQKGVGMMDYHGFMGARHDVIRSLERLRDAGADILIPAHGGIMPDVAGVVSATSASLESCFECYADISALRYHFPGSLAGYANGPSAMPFQQVFDVPEFLRHIETTWILLSETGDAFVMDCYSDAVIGRIKGMRESGAIRSVDGLWITHYHDDHVDAVQRFRDEFACEVIADKSVADVVSEPERWRLTCLSPNHVTVDRVTGDGESWTWNEYRMTAYHFPGQTLYHGGLLVEGRGRRIFFAGDSFTPSGIDDYCPFNRNFLADGAGYDRCIALLQDLRPDMIINPHVAPPFVFTDDAYHQMRENLRRRKGLFASLLPWDDPNYGIDDSWVVCSPYEQTARPGDRCQVDAVVTNHSDTAKRASCRLVPPSMWSVEPADPSEGSVGPGATCVVPLSIKVPADAATGRYAIAVDVEYGDLCLPGFTEFIVQVV